MRRRTLLATALGISLSGCLSEGTAGDDTPTEMDGSGDAGSSETSTGRRYEECPREVIPYEQFPRDVQTEIDVALEGEYTADRVFLREAIDTAESYVSVAGEYYDPTVTTAGNEERLTLEVVRPKSLPRSRSLSVEQDRDGERTITVRVADDDGTVLIEETRTLHPGGRVEFGETARVGTHELSVVVADDDRIETEWTGAMRVSESYFETIVVVDPNEISTTGAVADLGICRYESDYTSGAAREPSHRIRPS